MISLANKDVFCDYLRVTSPPGDTGFLESLSLFLDRNLYPVSFSKSRVVGRNVGLGLVLLQKDRLYSLASASGAALARMREDGCFEDYLSVLSSYPHTVTRLDAALDLDKDAPPFLRALERRYSDDKFSFGRKKLQVTRLYSRRESDNALTGSWYAGYKSRAKVTVRVYDKQNEVLAKTGVAICPRTRVELVFTSAVGATLRDAFMPNSIFYDHASPSLVPRPDGVPNWVPHGNLWASVAKEGELPIDTYKRRLETSPELDRLVELAVSLGPNGVQLAKRIYQEKLDSAFRAIESLEDSST